MESFGNILHARLGSSSSGTGDIFGAKERRRGKRKGEKSVRGKNERGESTDTNTKRMSPR